MKILKFSEPLPTMILRGEKDTTWRIDDEKDLQPGDELSLCYNNGEEFAKAKVVWVKETSFEHLSFEDKEGNEPFNSDSEMYSTYFKYYDKEIVPETRLKVIKFELEVDSEE